MSIEEHLMCYSSPPIILKIKIAPFLAIASSMTVQCGMLAIASSMTVRQASIEYLSDESFTFIIP